MASPIVIVGGGQAGLQAAESLRAEGYACPLSIVGEEPHAPYQRPPLSKEFLTGQMDERQLWIRAPAALERKSIQLVTGRRVLSIDRQAQQLTLDNGENVLPMPAWCLPPAPARERSPFLARISLASWRFAASTTSARWG